MRRLAAGCLALWMVALTGAAHAEPRLDGKCLLGVLGQRDDSLRARALWRSLGAVTARTRPNGSGFVRTYPDAGLEARLDGGGRVSSLRLMLRSSKGAELRRFRGRAPFRLDPTKLTETLRGAAARAGGAINRFRYRGLDVTLRLAGAPARFTEVTVATDPMTPIGDLAHDLRRCPYRRLAALQPKAPAAAAVPAPPGDEERPDTQREDAARAENAVDRDDRPENEPVLRALLGKKPRFDGDCLLGLLGRSLDGPEVATLKEDLGAPDGPSGYQLVFARGLELGGSFFDKRTVKEIHLDLGGVTPFPGRLPRLPPALLKAAAADASGFAHWNDGRIVYRLFVDAAGVPRKLTLLRESEVVMPLYGCAYAADPARRAEN